MNLNQRCKRSYLLVALCLCSWLGLSQAQQGLPHEQVIRIAKPDAPQIELETTLYKPVGEGPFPLVLLNHGKSKGNPKLQLRYRPQSAIAYFLQRGYVVMMPMRQGFANSGGKFSYSKCEPGANGLDQAQDIKTALDYASSQPYIDKNNILLVGQSHGGLSTLAAGTLNYPGVKGLINFAGGLREISCSTWENTLVKAATVYGKSVKVPSLWFYGDNDSYFPPPLWHAMYEGYRNGGSATRLVAFGNFGSDAHSLFGSRKGEAIWQPEVSAFLLQAGLPAQVLFPQYSPPPPLPRPPKTGFADFSDIGAAPFIGQTGRAAYQKFAVSPMPRAFAIASNGAWGWAAGGEGALAQALDNCNQRGKGICKLYAVDSDVVWPNFKSSDGNH